MDEAAPTRSLSHVVVVGDFFVDIQAQVACLPSWDGDVETPAVELLPGGSAANTARQLQALLPEKVRFFSTTGAGDFDVAAGVLRRLDSQGFDTSGIRRIQRASSCCIVLSGPQDRGFVSCYSSVKALAAEHLDREAVSSCSHLHIGGYFGLQGLQTQEFLELVSAAKAQGATVSLGTQSDFSGQWTGEDGHLSRLLPLVDLLICNNSEVQEISKALGGPVLESFPGLTVVETLGKGGSRALGSEGRCATQASEVVESPVDTCGAGDAFAAGFLARWLRAVGPPGRLPEAELLEALRWGNACARRNVLRRGACVEPVPRAELLAELAAPGAAAPPG